MTNNPSYYIMYIVESVEYIPYPMNYTGQQSAHIKQHAVAKRCHYSKYVHCIYNNKQSTAIKLKRVVEEYLTEERTITNISKAVTLLEEQEQEV